MEATPTTAAGAKPALTMDASHHCLQSPKPYTPRLQPSTPMGADRRARADSHKPPCFTPGSHNRRPGVAHAWPGNGPKSDLQPEHRAHVGGTINSFT